MKVDKWMGVIPFLHEISMELVRLKHGIGYLIQPIVLAFTKLVFHRTKIEKSFAEKDLTLSILD